MDNGNDQEIFDQAMSDLPATNLPAPEADKPETEAAPAEPDKGGQPRDPTTGQFATKPKEEGGKPAPAAEAKPAEQPKAEPKGEPQGDPSAEPKQDHRVPLAEHLSVRDERNALKAEREQSRAREEALQRQLDAMNRRIEEMGNPKAEPIDPWADPQGYIAQQLDPIRQGQESVVERMSRVMATDKFGAEAVNAALTELESRMRTDPMARFEHQRIMAADHPYGELVAWHKRQSALKEVGEDPAAYKARILEEAKKDPAFVAAIVEAARAQASQPGGNGQQRPSTAINLPPSLNRTTGGGGHAIEAVPRTDAEMFDAMFPTR